MGPTGTLRSYCGKGAGGGAGEVCDVCRSDEPAALKAIPAGAVGGTARGALLNEGKRDGIAAIGRI